MVFSDGAVGKTCLLDTYVRGEFPHDGMIRFYGVGTTSVGLGLDSLSLWMLFNFSDFFPQKMITHPKTDWVWDVEGLFNCPYVEKEKIVGEQVCKVTQRSNTPK